MHSATAVRRQIEAALGNRIPSALTPRPRTVREGSPTGIPEIDALLEGGLPLGAITELVGPPCSGRTTLAQAALAAITAMGKAVAWVDASDTLDPISAAAAGIDLSRQLWVRCGGVSAPEKVRPTHNDEPHSTPGAALLMEGSRVPAQSGGCGSPHPRGEARGLGPAVEAIFQNTQPAISKAMPASRGGEGRNPNPDRPNLRREKWIGTPSAPNRKLTEGPAPFHSLCSPHREEQIATDRLPPRRGANFKLPDRGPKNLSAAQIAYTGMVAGAWDDNRNNIAGRGLKTSPNAIAAGLPRFRELEELQARTAAATRATPQPLRPSEPAQNLPGQKHALSATPSASSRTSPNAQPGQPQPAAPASLAGDPPRQWGRPSSPVWKALDQALRATDLLLAGGGFSAIVLDLGSTPAEFAWRIPLATWFRFRAGAERSRAVLLVLTQHPCTRSSAELVLSLEATQPNLETRVLTGARFQVHVERQRFENNSPIPDGNDASLPGKLHLIPRKPPGRARSAVWGRKTAWAGGTQ